MLWCARQGAFTMSTGQIVGPPFDPFGIGSGGFEVVPDNWMPASHSRPLVQKDPCVLWLDWYGDKHGFLPSESTYSFNAFLVRKGKELEAAWLNVYTKNSVRVCQHDGDARSDKN